jgi:hypothetical protein
MKTKCESFAEDIAVNASDASALAGETAAHLRECESCREKLAELKSVATLQRQVETELPEPRLRLTKRQLERALSNDTGVWSGPRMQWQPVFAGALALVLIAMVMVMRRDPEQRVDTQNQTQQPQPELKAAEEVFEPTMLALRHELQGGREEILASAPTGGRMRHYRVKDVESELRN